MFIYDDTQRASYRFNVPSQCGPSAFTWMLRDRAISNSGKGEKIRASLSFANLGRATAQPYRNLSTVVVSTANEKFKPSVATTRSLRRYKAAPS